MPSCCSVNASHKGCLQFSRPFAKSLWSQDKWMSYECLRKFIVRWMMDLFETALHVMPNSGPKYLEEENEFQFPQMEAE